MVTPLTPSHYPYNAQAPHVHYLFPDVTPAPPVPINYSPQSTTSAVPLDDLQSTCQCCAVFSSEENGASTPRNLRNQSQAPVFHLRKQGFLYPEPGSNGSTLSHISSFAPSLPISAPAITSVTTVYDVTGGTRPATPPSAQPSPKSPPFTT